MERKSKDDELNKVILEWLLSKNHTASAEALMSETGLKKEEASKGQALEKRWGTIVILQKKVSDLENQVKILKEDMERVGAGGSMIEGGGYKKNNESMVSNCKFTFL